MWQLKRHYDEPKRQVLEADSYGFSGTVSIVRPTRRLTKTILSCVKAFRVSRCNNILFAGFVDQEKGSSRGKSDFGPDQFLTLLQKDSNYY